MNKDYQEVYIMKKISTDKAPAAIGPYSQGIVSGGMLYASGQIPIVPATGNIIEGDISVQAKQAIENVGEILKAAGSDYIEACGTALVFMEQSRSVGDIPCHELAETGNTLNPQLFMEGSAAKVGVNEQGLLSKLCQ